MATSAHDLRNIHPQLLTARTLEKQRKEHRTSQLASRVEPLDLLLEGGLATGGLVELVGRRSAGRFSTLLQTLSTFTRRGEVAGLIDLGDGLEPRVARAAGIDLSRLLWARPRHLKSALIATELLLNAGFPLVVLDLGMPPVPGGRGPEGSWMRLARAAQKHRGSLLISSPYRASGTMAAAVVEADKTSTRWRGSGRTPRLLGSTRIRLQLAKATGRGPAPPQSMCWHSAAVLTEDLRSTEAAR